MFSGLSRSSCVARRLLELLENGVLPLKSPRGWLLKICCDESVRPKTFSFHTTDGIADAFQTGAVDSSFW